jgi:hypothetical protein
MKHSFLRVHTFLLILLLLSSCTGKEETSDIPTPSSSPSSPSSLPVSDVVITVNPPEGTGEDSDLALILLDEVTGWAQNTTAIPMTMLEDGRWQVSLQPTTRSLLRYRYVRRSPGVVQEAGTDGDPVQNRTLYISGPIQVEDQIATWVGTPYSGEMGRVTGRLVDTQSGEPLREMIANIAGKTVFTDGMGNFRVDRLVPGLHTITAFSPDGSYSPAQQGAIVEANSTTPAEMSLIPANSVQVTFEVIVPGSTIEGTPVRIAANLRQFGHLFTQLPGGITNALGLMPILSEIDPTHYQYIANLYSGTHFRYKYTLGDGLINAERDELGAVVTRDLIVPEEDVVIEDTIASWEGEGQGNVLFWLDVPAETPPSDIVSLQLFPQTPTTPIPMWKIGDRQWFYTVYNYPGSEGAVGYRYCRNQQCGIADDKLTPGSDPQWRTFLPGSSKLDINDTIEGWSWFSPDEGATSIPPMVVEQRDGFSVGIEILPRYDPSWESHLGVGLRRISEIGANTVVLTPSWVVGASNPKPEIGFNPAFSPYLENLKIHIERARSFGLQVELHPYLQFESLDPSEWWNSAAKDTDWWSAWFDRYETFVLTFAQVANELQVGKIVLGGPELTPSLPADPLVDEARAEAYPAAEVEWQGLISEVRSIYAGKIAFEVDLRDIPTISPAFIDVLDEVYIYWNAPLVSDTATGIEAYQDAAEAIMSDSIPVSGAWSGKPISLSVEYASFDGSTLGCEGQLGVECYEAEIFDLGAEGNASLPIDLQEQAEAIYAVIAQAYLQPGIQGVYVRRYNPIVQLQDKSASVYGKPAQAVLELWYHQISGR